MTPTVVEYDGMLYHVRGWKRDLPDHRDEEHRFSAVGPVPDEASLEAYLPRVEDQRTLGSCVGHGTTSGVELLAIKNGHPVRELSRLFTYYLARRAENDVASDDGCMIRTAVACLNQYGCAREESWPYELAKYALEPPAEAFEEALAHRLPAYRRCYTLREVKAAIAEGFPVVFGFSVPERSMWTREAMASGQIALPAAGEGFSGGHCVLAFGYIPGQVRIRNSWGTSWGQGGNGSIDERYFELGLATDAWALTDYQYYARREQPTDEAAA
jgi:C1A family cysteine protease